MEEGIYVAATQEAVHKIARTTSFFHKGQLSGSSGSEVGCLSDKSRERTDRRNQDDMRHIVQLHVRVPEDMRPRDT